MMTSAHSKNVISVIFIDGVSSLPNSAPKGLKMPNLDMVVHLLPQVGLLNQGHSLKRIRLTIPLNLTLDSFPVPLKV